MLRIVHALYDLLRPCDFKMVIWHHTLYATQPSIVKHGWYGVFGEFNTVFSGLTSEASGPSKRLLMIGGSQRCLQAFSMIIILR